MTDNKKFILISYIFEKKYNSNKVNAILSIRDIFLSESEAFEKLKEILKTDYFMINDYDEGDEELDEEENIHYDMFEYNDLSILKNFTQNIKKTKNINFITDSYKDLINKDYKYGLEFVDLNTKKYLPYQYQNLEDKNIFLKFTGCVYVIIPFSKNQQTQMLNKFLRYGDRSRIPSVNSVFTNLHLIENINSYYTKKGGKTKTKTVKRRKTKKDGKK